MLDGLWGNGTEESIGEIPHPRICQDPDQSQSKGSAEDTLGLQQEVKPSRHMDCERHSLRR